jgi:hypothetical protein
MTLIQTLPFEVRELNIDEFRLELKDLEDDEGMPFLDTHSHNTTVTVGGTVLARVVSIINSYTVTFEDGIYAVNLVGANSNILDVANLNSVSIRSANSAGLIEVDTGGTATAIADAVWDEATSGHDTAGSFGEEVQTHATPIEVNAQADQALSDYDPPTKAELDTAESNIRGADSDDLKSISDQVDALPVSTADQVWDTTVAGHTTPGTFGATIDNLDTRLSAVRAAYLDQIPGITADTVLIRKILKNRLRLTSGGTTANWILYDDDNITPLLTWDVSDITGLALNIQAGIPSQRSAGY